MKILFAGASGMIGGDVLAQCLANPAISSVVAFVRRDLPTEVASHPKLHSVIIKDFSSWNSDVLKAHEDAAAMIWAMGSYDGNVAVDFDYPVAFIEEMAKVLEAKANAQKFRFILLGGKFVRQDQDTKLWFLEQPRKLKGRLEAQSIAFAESHAAIWETFVVKPGGIITSKGGLLNSITSLGAIMGENWSIRSDELGAFMAYLAIGGSGEQSIIENARLVRRGRELLQARQS